MLLFVGLVKASKPVIENEAVEGDIAAETFILSTVVDWKYYVFVTTVTLYKIIV